MNDAHQERFEESLAAYALGALDEREARELERHLEGCESCRAELRRLAPAVRALPETVERAEPPPQLRERLLAEVRADARRSGAVAAERVGAMERLRGFLGGRRGRPIVALATLLLVVAAVAGYVVGRNGGGSGGGASTVVSGQAPGIVATVVREGGRGRLELTNVPSLPAGRVLEAWVKKGAKVKPVPTLFLPNRAGEAATPLGDVEGVERVMVTAEPTGGSTEPTSEPIADVSLQ